MKSALDPIYHFETVASTRAFAAKDVTIAVLNYNGVKIIPDLFRSIRKLSHPPGEVILVDDGSSDGSPDWVRKNCPEVPVFSMGRNTKLLNLVRNRAVKEAKGDLVFIVDNDVILDSECLDRLLDAMNTLPNAAACITRALFLHDPAKIYTDGSMLHYVGSTPYAAYDLPITDANPVPRLSIGWGVQLLNKQIVADAGYFNDSYAIGWGNDYELNHRLHLVGFKCYQVPSAIVYHRRVTGDGRFYGVVRNRWQFILEMYSWKTVLVCLPALAVYELSLILFMVYKGRGNEYVRGMFYVLTHLRPILASRRAIQRKRRVSDRDLMTSDDIFVFPEHLKSRFILFGYRGLNAFLNAYWKLVRRIV